MFTILSPRFPNAIDLPANGGAVIPQELTEGAQLLYLCFVGIIVDSLSKDANVPNIFVALMVLSLDGLNGALKMKATEFELLLANSQESEVQLQVRGMDKYLSDEFEVVILLDSCIK